MTFPGLEKMEFHDFSRFSMTGCTLLLQHKYIQLEGLYIFVFTVSEMQFIFTETS